VAGVVVWCEEGGVTGSGAGGVTGGAPNVTGVENTGLVTAARRGAAGDEVEGVEDVDVEEWREARELSTSREVAAGVGGGGVADLSGVTDRLDVVELTGSRAITSVEVTESVRGRRMTTDRLEGGVTGSRIAIIGVLGDRLLATAVVRIGLREVTGDCTVDDLDERRAEASDAEEREVVRLELDERGVSRNASRRRCADKMSSWRSSISDC
jgi:hypothetical protein